MLIQKVSNLFEWEFKLSKGISSFKDRKIPTIKDRQNRQ